MRIRSRVLLSTLALVIQIQDLRLPPGGGDAVSRITIRNNVIHDSRDNDLLKINFGASDVTVEGNLFYNQSGSDEHIDINSARNVVVQDNVFFNDFAASGRTNGNDTSGFIVIKDSDGAAEGKCGPLGMKYEFCYTTFRAHTTMWHGSAVSHAIALNPE